MSDRRPIKRKRELAPKAVKQFLTLETMSGLSNGQVAAAVNAAMRAAIRDTEDRGADKKVRSVSIEVDFAKVSEDTIAVAVKCKTKMPAYVTQPTFGNIVFDGVEPKVEFNPHSADEPAQATLHDDPEEDDDEKDDDNETDTV